MSELRLHTNIAIDRETADYYHNSLYNLGDYAPFLMASLESMRQVFYIELHGFIGAFWNTNRDCLEGRNNDKGSLYA
jgi:hypothetical protein